MTTQDSKLTKHQTKTFGPVFYTEHGGSYKIVANVRYDDRCGNGYNAFSITADIQRKDERGAWREDSGGCCHDEVAKHFPQLAPLIKWHLTSADGPMHYVANTVYHAGNRDCNGLLKGEFRQHTSAAVWPDATDEDLTAPGLEERLNARLPALMAEFRVAVESLGFTY